MELLEDRVGNLDVAAVSTAPVDARFVSAALQSTNIGFSSSAWWARVTLRNPSNASRLVYLRQDYPLIDLLDLYEPKAGGGWPCIQPGIAGHLARATWTIATSCSLDASARQ